MPSRKHFFSAVALTLLFSTPPLRADAYHSVIHKYLGVECFKKDSHGVLELGPNAHCREQFVKDGRIVLDKPWNTDEYGRRVVPQSAASRSTSGFVAFLGCSFTFGEAVSDAETLPAQLAKSATDWRFYDYGMHGSGPGDMLHRVETSDLNRQIPQHHGKFAYIWIEDHA